MGEGGREVRSNKRDGKDGEGRGVGGCGEWEREVVGKYEGRGGDGGVGRENVRRGGGREEELRVGETVG